MTRHIGVLYLSAAPATLNQLLDCSVRYHNNTKPDKIIKDTWNDAASDSVVNFSNLHVYSQTPAPMRPIDLILDEILIS